MMFINYTHYRTFHARAPSPVSVICKSGHLGAANQLKLYRVVPVWLWPLSPVGGLGLATLRLELAYREAVQHGTARGDFVCMRVVRACDHLHALLGALTQETP